MTGVMGLTRRQERVALLIAEGWQDKQIAALLGVRPQTIRQVVMRIAIVWRLDRARNIRVQIARRVACPTSYRPQQNAS